MKPERVGIPIGRLLLLSLVLLPCLPGMAGRLPRGTRVVQSVAVVPGEVVLKIRDGGIPDLGGLLKGSSRIPSALRAAGITSVRRAFPYSSAQLRKQGSGPQYDLTRIYVASFSPDQDPGAVAGRLAKLPEIEYAEPKYLQHVLDTPNDPLLGNQSQALARMNVLAGWSIAKGSRSVAIAVVDGGEYWRHEDLQANVWINSAEDLNHDGAFEPGPPPAGDEDGIDQDGNGFVDDVIGWNFATATNDPTGLASEPGNASHGTAVSSHFGAVTNNGKGMAGTSWNCALLPICAAAPGSDNLIQFGYEGIEYAARMGARVINCSWGRPGGFSNFEQEVIDAASAAGALIVAAAGNASANSDYSPQYPANYRGVLGIGATNTNDDVRAAFSNYGVTVRVYAPGVSIFSALTTGGYGNGGSGTSFSSPLVAGLAGLLFSAHPSWTPQQVAAQIRVTADSMDAVPGNAGESGRLGRGRVNFARALSENHAALEIASVTMMTPAGKDLFVRSDTVFVNVTVRNVLITQANTVQFKLSSFDQDLEVLSGSATVNFIAPGQAVALPRFVCQVSSFAAARAVVLKLEWVSNGNEADAAAFRTFVYPSSPLWLSQNSPTLLSLFSIRAVGRDVAWASGGNGTGTEPVVLRTTNGGGDWNIVTSNLPQVDLYCIDGVDQNHAWVGTGGGQIYATTNGGQSWAAQPYGGVQSPFIDGIFFFDTRAGYALGDPPAGSSQFILLRTSDGGSTWNHFPSEAVGAGGEAGWNNSFWWSDPRHGWFGTNLSHVWRTSDGGTTWQSAPSGGTSSFGVAFRDSLTGVAGHNDGRVARTTDGGLSWTVVTFPSTLTVTGVAYAPGEHSVWVSTASELFRSSDDGTSWALQLASPFSGGINHLSFADSSHGWAVTSNGEILRHLLIEADTSSTPPLPDAYLLAQNFPNPFNTSTVIRYDIPGTGAQGIGGTDVRLAVYDVLGREVTVLVNVPEIPGTYDVKFDGSALASGVYFYRLAAGKFVLTRKMVLIK